MTDLNLMKQAENAPEFPVVSFGRMADDLAVALVDKTAFAMAPAGAGRYRLVTAWSLSRPMAEWTLRDFYGHCGDLADEAAFRTRVLENAEHQREKRALGRREIDSRAYTPWGPSQGATVYAEGIIFHSTASHGGFHLSAERNRDVLPTLRDGSCFYEEDEGWAIVALSFPHLFTAFERGCAESTIKDSWPEAWEAIFGTVLLPGESWSKDKRAFEIEHAADWIVTAAISSSHEKGFVECVATIGGKRGAGTEERRFLVASAEYEVGRFGFVIDLDRHHVYGGPSDFIGWRPGRAA